MMASGRQKWLKRPARRDDEREGLEILQFQS